MNIISKVRNLVAKNKLESATNELVAFLEERDNELYHQIILISSRYQKYKKDEINGLEPKSVVLNNIGHSIMQLLSEVEEVCDLYNADEPVDGQENNFETVKELTKIPYFNVTDLVDRKEFVKSIHESFVETESLVIIHGIGGIGKSAIALAYANNQEFMQAFNHIAWVTIVGDIKVDLAQNLSNDHTGYRYKADSDIDENFDFLINQLREIKGNNLLILDNVNDVEQLLRVKNDLLRSNFKILVTSRSAIKYVKSIQVDELSDDHAKELFYRYFLKSNNDTVLDKLFNKTGKHTLLIELLAKVGNENPFLDEIEDLHELYDANGLSAEGFNLDIQIGNKEDRLFDHISNIFDVKSITETEIKYLRYFSVLPSTEIDIKILVELFNVSDENKIYFVNTLNAISRKGWLINNIKQFKCHQITQEILREKLKPDVINCMDLLENILSKIFHTGGFSENSLSKLPYLIFAENIWSLFSREEKIVLEIADQIAKRYNNLGEYTRSLRIQADIIKIKESKFSDCPDFIAFTKDSLAMTNRRLGRYSEALSLAEEAVSLMAEYETDKYLKELASYHNNLGLMFRQFRRNKEARNHYLKSIGYLEELRKGQDSGVNVDLLLAVRYNNLAFIYNDLGDYGKEIEYQRKSVKMRENNYESSHPSLAIAYSNLGASLVNCNELEEAKKNFDRSFEIKNFNYGEDSVFMCPLYRNIAKYYLKMNDIENSFLFIDKAIEIQIEKTNNEHPKLSEMHKIKSDVYKAEGDILNAMKSLKEAIRILSINFSEEHTDLQEYNRKFEALKNKL